MTNYEATGCKILVYVELYLARSYYINQKIVVMNWYGFFGHEYRFFDATVSCLIALNTLKSQNNLGLCLQKAHQGSVPDPKL